MATLNGKAAPSAAPASHQRAKSSVLRPFVKHRRNNSQGEALDSAILVDVRLANGPLPPVRALEEMSHNRQHQKQTGAVSRPPAKAVNQPPRGIENDPDQLYQQQQRQEHVPTSPMRKARTKSTTSLVGLLTRPKSFINLQKLANMQAGVDTQPEKEDRGCGRLGKRDESSYAPRGDDVVQDKENYAPTQSAPQAVPPIYAQFCGVDADASNGRSGRNNTGVSTGGSAGGTHANPSFDDLALMARPHLSKARPMSYHPASTSASNSSTPISGPPSSKTFCSVREAESAGPGSAPSIQSSCQELAVDPEDIDTHLEALLDRRNIPEHQRYKMRNLANTIKMEFIRQDWAEERAKRQKVESRPRGGEDVTTQTSHATATSAATPTVGNVEAASPTKGAKSKHSRVKSMTLSKVTRGRSRERGPESANDSQVRHKSPGSPLKRRFEGGTLARHLRSKSTESIARKNSNGDSKSDGATSESAAPDGPSNSLSGLFAKSKGPQQLTPLDFVTYLRTVQEPEKVEVGKLHKLRLLLRNETVAWTEEFIGLGGMEEVVYLLYRILAVEWREEHEDALLHENLLCLKALCTTALALHYMHSIHGSLFPALIHMIFDPEKKGPSEFTTRNIVTWVLFTYIQRAPVKERASRAQTVLGYLRDPEAEEDNRPVGFVLEMRKDRPYRVWCKEVVNVTKEVFWIFLHHLNVIALPATAKEARAAGQGSPEVPQHGIVKEVLSAEDYMQQNFPQERPPVPAAPYVGGVEWEATNYLASHLDLVNAIVACVPTAAERNELRRQMQMSGWERCMGGTLRLCKEKFYGAVHGGLRTWVAAAFDDGWDSRDVRYGPPAPSAERSESGSGGKTTEVVGGPKAGKEAPKLAMPKLDFVLDD